MSTEPIVLEPIGPHTARLRLNRPDRLNAMDPATFARFHRILGDLAGDPALRAVVLTGTGRAFSAGADLKEMQARPQGDATVRDATATLHLYQDTTRRLTAHPAVFIAAINGLAVGVGAELALAADVRIGSDTAELRLPEVQRGLFGTNGVLHLLPRVVGQGRAADWLLTGRPVPAAELLAAGFLTEVVPADRLQARAVELAETIAGNAPVSVRLVKALLRRTWEVDLEAMLQYEVDGMLRCMASDDIEEGLRAFLEKRPPRWQGR
jgi:enoyl-CoA hydratase/carnithine racemase